MIPAAERWELGARPSRYHCAPRNKDEGRQLAALSKVEFDALSIGRRGNGPQVAIIPLDESSQDHARLIVSAPELLAAVRLMLPEAERRLPHVDILAIKRLLIFIAGPLTR